MNELRLKPLEPFNFRHMNMHRIAQDAKVSWPTVRKYFAGGSPEPSMVHVTAVLHAMGVDWRDVKLGELLENIED